MMMKDKINGIFDSLDPTDEQISKMKKNIETAANRTAKVSCRPKLLPIAAAVLVMAIGVTAVSAAPALKRYFFPGVGIVESGGENAEPLYMMLDKVSADNSSYTVTNGYWHDGTARFWLETKMRYDLKEASELLPYTDAIVENIGVSQTTFSGGMIGLYSVTVPNVTSGEAAEGLLFDGHAVKFSGMPAEYRPYSTEECGLKLIMIPLTETLDTFAIELEYTDGRGGNLIPMSSFAYSTYTVENGTLNAVDENGTVYPLEKIRGTNIFSTGEKPDTRIVRFESDCITFSQSFDEAESATVTTELPENGTAKEINKEFTFPDGVTKGMISAISYNAPINDELDVEPDKNFPSGYISVVTDASESNGIRYWYNINYTAEYNAFIEPYLTLETKSPYEKTHEPMAPRMTVRKLEDGICTSLHYIDDGSGKFDAHITHYTAQAFADWSIVFDSAEIAE